MTTPQAPAWSPPPQQQLQGPPPVQVFVAAPQKQNRLTVLVRAILAIPQGIVLFVMAIGAEVVAFLGWWGALFTGRLPGFATTYLTGFVRYLARYQAYICLLTDQYPPFTVEDVPDYPVRVATTREPLNRFAVFFRFILVVPTYFLSAFLGFGAFTIVLFVTWVLTLITGEVPAPLHQAYAVIFRYQVRFTCYACLLTPTYPVRGVFGDQQSGEPVQTESAQAEEPPSAPVDPASWRLLLTPAAKGLAIGFLVLGIILYGGQVTYQAVRTQSASAANSGATAAATASRTVQQATAKLMTSMEQTQKTVSNCGQNLKCVTAADTKAATYFQDYGDTVGGMSVPSNAAELAGKLAGTAQKVSFDYTQMGQATTPKQYTTLAQNSLNQDTPQLQSAMAALQKVLSQDKKTNVGV